MLKIKLCTPPKGCCPTVEIREDEVIIGEGENTCRLSIDEFRILKEKILSNEI